MTKHLVITSLHTQFFLQFLFLFRQLQVRVCLCLISALVAPDVVVDDDDGGNGGGGDGISCIQSYNINADAVCTIGFDLIAFKCEMTLNLMMGEKRENKEENKKKKQVLSSH